MARHCMDKKDISTIVKKTYRQTSKILACEKSKATGKPYVFDIQEAVEIVKHFRNLGENITLDEIFFDDVFSIANNNVS